MPPLASIALADGLTCVLQSVTVLFSKADRLNDNQQAQGDGHQSRLAHVLLVGRERMVLDGKHFETAAHEREKAEGQVTE